MQLWQTDIMGEVRLVDGAELKLISGVDDHSRYCVIAALFRHATGRDDLSRACTAGTGRPTLLPWSGAAESMPARWVLAR